ncbi:Sensor histidine kinase TmoS [Pseudovibrio axinellae]|uniref:histidine kinase n=1 Tax=Pseudovibrio axinellae TaxID=989403 RepID=A0A165ZRB9_9HYPH|nr:HAMP domain-containing sensor histidine kinase [Pseudovibrio axinellae]KZL20198.1 Sensor histidine kinase TmoS [Pseudovibrio axinellae]SEQ60564.1 Signal transduction histidine kinase [Pseudovibrio axinellae]
MAQKNGRAASEAEVVTEKRKQDSSPPDSHPKLFRSGMGLSGKLLMLTVLFVMLSEVLIFVPSIANFRNNWLQDRLAVGGVAATLLSESETLSPKVQHQLLDATGAQAISLVVGERRKLIAMDSSEMNITKMIDITRDSPWGGVSCSLQFLTGLRKGQIRVIGDVDMRAGGRVDMVFPASLLRDDLRAYALNILQLSLIISCLTAALVYLSIRSLLLRPLQRLTGSMMRFAESPENAREIIKLSGRSDELGEAEIQLQSMQRSLNQTLSQQRRMAALGLAVSKINHDMRNLLASAQLFLERLELLPDPTVQRIAPKILATLDRAASYTSAVLSYGKAQEAAPELRVIRLAAVLRDVEEVLGLSRNPDGIRMYINVPESQELEADPEQIFRVLLNLCRNSVQAMETSKPASGIVCRIEVHSQVEGEMLSIYVSDTGPGIPEKAQNGLFKAFQTSGKVGGIGLGLAIATEIVVAHGGKITLEKEITSGACFKIQLPYKQEGVSHGKVARLFTADGNKS